LSKSQLNSNYDWYQSWIQYQSLHFQSIAKILLISTTYSSSPMQCALIKAINLINRNISMHNCCINSGSSDELQEFKSITRFKAEILKQLLGNIKIERSMTLDQSITAIWARRSIGLRLAFTNNHDSIVIYSIQSRKKKRDIEEMI
jgi:hypothetical protein